MWYFAVTHSGDTAHTTDVVAKHFQSRAVCAMAGATHAGDDRRTHSWMSPDSGMPPLLPLGWSFVPRRPPAVGKVLDTRSRQVKNQVALALRGGAQCLDHPRNYLGEFYRRIRCTRVAGHATDIPLHFIGPPRHDCKVERGMIHTKRRLLLPCALVSAIFGANLPYVGKWKMNLAKSDFGQTTITYESLPGGEWRATGFGVTSKFKMDGQDYSDGMGGTAAWKAVDADTWEIVGKVNGKVTASDTLKLSADGKTLTDNGKQMKPGGGTMDVTTVYQRVSGGPGLGGKWQTKNVSGAAGVIEIAQSGTDGLSFKDSDMGVTCDSKLDGKDYPCTGPMMPPGFTIAMKNAPPRSLDVTMKKDGKPFVKTTYTVAPDGKSMVETGGAVASTEKVKITFDRM